MKRVYLILLLFTLPSVNLAATGFTGINMSLAIYHGSTNTNDGDTSTSTTNKNSNMAIGLGAAHEEGMYLGSIYDLTVKNDGSGNLQDSNLGLSVGFVDRGSYIIYHHFFSANYERDSTTKYKGTGMGFDVGYQMPLGYGFSVGGQFAYKKFKFKEKTVNTEKTDTDYSRETILPSIILGFSF